MKDKIIIITGASDGIGAEAARQLHTLGATVVIIGRSEEKTKMIADELGADYYVVDFAHLDAVRKLGSDLRAKYPRIDVLVNNAGGIFSQRTLTDSGYEMTMQVNHLAHFLLTNILLDILIVSGGTVINTSSVAARLFSDFDVTDLNVQNNYSPNKAYGNAKLENILFTKELHRRYHDKGITAVAFHPGNVATSFASNTTSLLRFVYMWPFTYLFGLITPSKGADTMVWLATAKPGSDWQSGEYYYKRNIGSTSAIADDPAIAAELWNKSVEMTKSGL